MLLQLLPKLRATLELYFGCELTHEVQHLGIVVDKVVQPPPNQCGQLTVQFDVIVLFLWLVLLLPAERPQLSLKLALSKHLAFDQRVFLISLHYFQYEIKHIESFVLPQFLEQVSEVNEFKVLHKVLFPVGEDEVVEHNYTVYLHPPFRQQLEGQHAHYLQRSLERQHWVDPFSFDTADELHGHHPALPLSIPQHPQQELRQVVALVHGSIEQPGYISSQTLELQKDLYDLGVV